MAVTADSVIVELEAKIDEYKRKMREAADATDRATSDIGDAVDNSSDKFNDLADGVSNSTNEIEKTLKNLAGTIAAAFSLREAQQIVDTYTRIQNQLKVVGLEGGKLTDVQQKLFQSAQKFGAEYESVVTVFSKGAQVQKDLGASQEQLLQLTDAVGAALKVQGSSAAQAQGALLQLGQALGSGIVRAEEFNSIIEGALPLAQAAARGIDGYGGSVAKLRAAIADGNITSQQFFEGVLKGAPELLDQAAAATLALSGAFQQLKNATVEYVGEAAQSNGVTDAVAAGVTKLAENIDTLATAIAIVGTALGVGYVTNAVAARAATFSLTAAGAGLSKMLGGPVGIALTTVAIGLAATANAAQEADAALKGNAEAADELGISLSAASKQALEAASETKGVGDSARGAEPQIFSFKNAVDGLTRSLYDQAKAARIARIELLRGKLEQAQERQDTGLNATNPGRRFLLGERNNALKKGDLITAFKKDFAASVSLARSAFSGGRTAKEGKAIFEEASKQAAEYKRRIDELESKPIGADDIPVPGQGSAVSGRPPKKTKVPKGPRGKSAADIEAERLAIAERAMDEEMRLAQEELQARLELTTNIDERAALEKDLLALERSERIRQIENNKDYTKAQKDAQLAAINRLYGNPSENTSVDADGTIVSRPNQSPYSQRIQKEFNEKYDRLANDALAQQAETLRAQADVAISIQDRNYLEQRALTIQQEIERNLLAQAIATGDVADAEQARALLAQRQAAASEQQRLRQLTPGERYVDDINSTATNINDAIEGIQVQGLESLNSELADAITGAQSLGDAFSNVADQIINDLIRIAIQQAVIKPLANSLFGGDAGGGFLASLIGSIGGGRASGGHTRGGQTYMVGENGPELFSSAQSGKIYPTGALAAAGGGGRNVVVNQTINYDGRNSVTPAGFAQQIRQENRQFSTQAARSAYEASPQRSRRAQQLGT